MPRGRHRRPGGGGIALTREQLALIAFIAAVAAVISTVTDVAGLLRPDTTGVATTDTSAAQANALSVKKLETKRLFSMMRSECGGGRQSWGSLCEARARDYFESVADLID